MSQKGFNLLELMISSSIITGIGLVIAEASAHSTQVYLQTRRTSELSDIKFQIIDNLRNNQQWSQIVANNPTILGCTLNNSCTGLETGTIQVTNQDGEILADLSNSNFGYSNNIKRCGTFGPNSIECPYKFEVTAKINCINSPCTSYRIALSGTLLVASDSLKSKIDLRNFSFEEKRINAQNINYSTVVCATASYQGLTGSVNYDYGNTGFTTSAEMQNIFTLSPPDTTAMRFWGVYCKTTNNYYILGCSINKTTPTGDLDRIIENNGCKSDGDSAITNELDNGSTLAITCCTAR